jgi:hypothetical protein
MKLANLRVQTIALAGAVAFCLVVRADDDMNFRRPTVNVSVTATGSAPLHYRWRSTDGTIQDIDAPATSWRLPSGPGLHFAYVLVSDGLGGYTEGRVGVNTDDLGTAPESLAAAPVSLHAPAAPARKGDDYRGYIAYDIGQHGRAYSKGVSVYVTDGTGARYPSSGSVLTDERGAFSVRGVPNGASMTIYCSSSYGAPQVFCGSDPMPATAFTDYLSNSPGGSTVLGRVTLSDGAPCGTNNELFGLHTSATVQLQDQNGARLLTFPVNAFGDWSVVLDPYPQASQVLFRCEGAAPIPVTLPNSYQVPDQQFAGTAVPVISGMTAPLNGNPGLFQPEPSTAPPSISSDGLPTVGTDWSKLPPGSNFPSDYITRSDDFLAFKGSDTRRAACQYYKAIGAVHGCRRDGRFVGPISYEDWRRSVNIGKYAKPGGVKAAATYVNKVDLNLTRVQESVRYGTTSLAAVVCNHLGPPVSSPDDVLNPSQASIDTAVRNAIAGRNLVACVAMDYQLNPGVNGDRKFVRFYVFGPSGELLPSVNLDGRGEKFMPGSCVSCHGGDHYAGGYPSDGSGFADFGGHMLPYDKGNFEFSDEDGLTDEEREEAIYGLNQNLLAVDPPANPQVAGALTLAGQNLISGWYTNPTLPAHTLDLGYIPQSWRDFISGKVTNSYYDPTYAKAFYLHVASRSCRTCHVNQITQYNFDDFSQLPSNFSVFFESATDVLRTTAGCGASSLNLRITMPNSAVTFNRYWLSQGTTDPKTNESTDQPSILSNFYPDPSYCNYSVQLIPYYSP